MKDNNLTVGRRGESIAREYLEAKGYIILEHNFRNKYSEIDLIAKQKDILVFIEVRTKTSERFGTPEESINKNKIKRLIRSAQAYTAYKRYQDQSRIDAVCVVLGEDGHPERINHYESIT
ncbi:MAG: YraN family protein [Candidatus Omnitrophota bacterium]